MSAEKTYTFRIYSKSTLPRSHRDQIRDSKWWNKTCQRSVYYKDPGGRAHSYLSARFVAVAIATVPGKGSELVGFATLFHHTHRTTLDDVERRVCKPDEIYIDALCIREGEIRGTGTAFVNHILRQAKVRFGKSAVRLYATDDAKRFWTNRGFVECDDPCTMYKPCEPKRYVKDEVWRMTRCLDDF